MCAIGAIGEDQDLKQGRVSWLSPSMLASLCQEALAEKCSTKQRVGDLILGNMALEKSCFSLLYAPISFLQLQTKPGTLYH